VSAWHYRAVDGSGRVLRGVLAAGNEAELDQRLLQIGLQLINFCFHLGQAQRAGLPILEALRDLRDASGDGEFRNVLAALSLAVEGGESLSGAMARFPATFDNVFTSLVRAGERSGELAEVLAQMTGTLKWQDELVAQTRKLVMYPAFVGTVVTGVVFFLMIYVVPQMTEFLKSMEQEIPLHTRALIATSEFVQAWWWAVVTVPVVAVLGLRLALQSSATARRAFDGLKLRAPVFGPILQKIIMSRFATYFQIMYASGITVVEALQTSRDLAGNAVVAAALERVSGYVAEGNSLSMGLERAGLFPPLVLRMVKMGEDIGQLDESLKNVSYFFNREVTEAVDRLQVLIEPAMTVILGLILGWVMLAVLGPIYDTISQIAV
jgi:type IV pilus assembly protein PilC